LFKVLWKEPKEEIEEDGRKRLDDHYIRQMKGRIYKGRRKANLWLLFIPCF
jgi:hypothetical protein